MFFENSLPKANFGQNIRDSPNGLLTADSRSLQTASLKFFRNLLHRQMFFLIQTDCFNTSFLFQPCTLFKSFYISSVVVPEKKKMLSLFSNKFDVLKNCLLSVLL